MFGLTSLGIVHTLISLFAVAAGIILFVRDGKISLDTSLGKFYVVTTIIVCITGFGIFQHGGFGKPHALGVITLIVLGIAYAAGKKKSFGQYSPYIELVGYSMTFFFHVVPGVTESATRLPLGAPLAASPDDPRIQMAIGVCFVLFVIAATIQVRNLRSTMKAVK